MDCHVYLFSIVCILGMFQQLDCAPTTSNIPELSSTKSDDTSKNGISSTIVNTSTNSGNENEVSTTELSNEGVKPIVNAKNGGEESQEKSLIQEKLSDNNPMSWSRVKRGEEDDEEPPCSQDDNSAQTVDTSVQAVENSSGDETGNEEDSSDDNNDDPVQSDSSDTDCEKREERSAYSGSFEGADDRRALSSWYGEPFGRRYWSSNERHRKFLAIPIFNGR